MELSRKNGIKIDILKYIEDGKVDWKGESVDRHCCRRSSPDSEKMEVLFRSSVFQVPSHESTYPLQAGPSRWFAEIGEHRQDLHEARQAKVSEICGF